MYVYTSDIVLNIYSLICHKLLTFPANNDLSSFQDLQLFIEQIYRRALLSIY